MATKRILIEVHVDEDTDIFDVHEDMLDHFDDEDLAVWESPEAYIEAWRGENG